MTRHRILVVVVAAWALGASAAWAGEAFKDVYDSGQAKYKAKAYAEARTDFERALALAARPEDTCAALSRIGATYYRQGQYDAAIEWYVKALRVDGVEARRRLHAQTYLGLAYQHSKQYDAALAAFDKTLAIEQADPNSRGYYRELALRGRQAVGRATGDAKASASTAPTPKASPRRWRGPFPEAGIRRVLVTTVTAATATILWTTAEAECGQVVAWTQDGKRIRVQETTPVKDHSVTLEGLAPDAVYHYFISGPSGRSYLTHVRTVAPLPGEPELTMAVIADPQFDGVTSGGGRNFRNLVAEVNQGGVDLVLVPGDMVDNRNSGGHVPDFTRDAKGYAKTFGAFKELAAGFRMPWYVVPGNHERLHQPGVRELYLRLFELDKAYYSFDFRGRHFVCLDCGSPKLLDETTEQFKWLDRDLAANRDKDVYVQLHYAVANDPYVFDGHRGVIPHVQKRFEEHGRVRAVYNGHKNVVSATIQNGILYVSCPQPTSVAPGYLVVRVHRDGLVQTFRRTPGVAGLSAPSTARDVDAAPGKLRWDCMYRHGRQEARNFSWRFGAPVTSTGVR